MTHMVEDENQKSQTSDLYMGTMACVHPHAQTHIINKKCRRQREWVEKGIHRHHRVIGYKFQAAGCATSHELLAGKIPGTPKTKKAIATAVGYITKLDCESLRLRTLHTLVARI